MASPVISVANFALLRGESFLLTSTQLSATDADSDLSYFKATVLPTRGSIRYKKLPVTLTTQIPIAAVAAGLVEYVHDGSANNDAVTFRAVDALGAESGNGAITITANVNATAPYMLFLVPTNEAPIVPFVGIRKWEAEDIATQWKLNHGGASYVIAISTLDVDPPLVTNATTYVPFALSTPEGFKVAEDVEVIKERLMDLFLTGDYNSTKTLVNTNGGRLVVPGAVALNEAQETEWREVRNQANVGNVVRRFAESSALAHALEELKGTLS
jgi:hypothetical protein